MTVTQGQDPERVEQVGVALSALADRVDVVAQTGTSGMGVLGQSWSGPDVESFGQQWQGAHRSLGDASAMLRLVSERARQQAADQRAASGEGGGGAPGTGGTAQVRTSTDPGGGRRGPLPSAEDVEIPYPDDGRPWVPQGFGYSEEEGAYVWAFYDHDNPEQGLLAIQTEDGQTRYVPVEGNDHYGGLAVDGDNVYVSGNGEEGSDGSYVQRYSLDTLLAAGGDDTSADPTAPVETVRVPTGSTLTVADGRLVVAEYLNRGDADGDTPTVYEYELGPDGELPTPAYSPGPPSTWMPEPVHTFEAPYNIQGLVSDGEHYYFTQSRGPDDPSNLVQVDPVTGEQTVVRDDLSPLSQGLVIRDGQLVISNESDAEPYRQDVLDSDNPFLPNGLENPVKPDGTLQEVELDD